jgi:3-hydroxyisobutyrate dehydrogenase-like beta-hydroxyacid dehydrogenase
LVFTEGEWAILEGGCHASGLHRDSGFPPANRAIVLPMNVAFLGLGTMGSPMAANILRGGHSLTVWNRTAARAKDLVAAGAALADSPAAASAGKDVVVTMLSDVDAVQTVIAGADGVASGIGPGTIVIDMSTVDRATALRMNEVVVARGGQFIDAPVSGSRKPAREGTLLIIAGGPADAIERARPVLTCMGRVRHVGPVGQGMAMKLVLNALGAHMMIGFAAVMVLGGRLGLDPGDMMDVISGGAFASPMYGSKGDKILRRDFTPDFTLALLRKDQALVLGAAAELGYPMPTEQAILDVLDEALRRGLGDQDMAAVFRLFESWAERSRS